MIIPGLCSITFRQLASAEIVKLVSAAGLQAIEWGGDVHVPPGDEDAARKVRDLTLAAGLRVSSYGSYYKTGQGREKFAEVLRSAEKLGAPIIRIWAGEKSSAAASPEDFQAVVRDIRQCAALAAEKNIGLSLEFHDGTLTDSNAAALTLLDALPESNLTIYWQPKPGIPHAERLDGLRKMRPRLSNLHVFQWQADHTRLPLAEGETEWPVYFREAGGERFALLEFVAGDSIRAFQQDAAMLLRWLQPAKSGT